MATKRNSKSADLRAVNSEDRSAIEAAGAITVKNEREFHEALRKYGAGTTESERKVTAHRLNTFTLVMVGAQKGFLSGDDAYKNAAKEYGEARGVGANSIKQYAAKFATVGNVAKANGADVKRILNASVAYKLAYDAGLKAGAKTLSLDDALYATCRVIKTALKKNKEAASDKHNAEVLDNVKAEAEAAHAEAEFDALTKAKAFVKALKEASAKSKENKTLPRSVASDFRSMLEYAEKIVSVLKK